MNLQNFSMYDEIVISENYPLKIGDAKMILLSFVCWVSWFNIIRVSPMPFKPAHTKVSKEDEFDVKNRCTAFCHGLSLLIGATYTYYIMPGSCGEANK
jgi:hypothetical protein